jgi:2-C-methyl-D-erythritol 4-phosphate cytidylyltransferase
MKNVAIILAGGEGRRMGGDRPKQFLDLGGRSVIERCVDVFEANGRIDEIAVVMHADYVEEMREMVKSNGWQKVSRVLCGGAKRYLSTVAALEAYKGVGECNMIFHDAARPFVSERIINDVVDALKEYEAVGVAVPMTDTVFEVDERGGVVVSIPRRSSLRRAQTPQGFRYSIVSRAYELALKDEGFASTDDCGTVLRYVPEVKIHLVDGDESNIKLTYKEDLKKTVI